MFKTITNNHSVLFDEVLKARRSVRSFSSKPINKESINEIIKAGFIAPFAAIPAAGKNDFRKAFIFHVDSDTTRLAKTIIESRLITFSSEMERLYGPSPYVLAIKKAAQVPFERILANAPYLVIVGERKGIPDNASESLSYCIENMWLKATSLKIGFRLLALISQLQLQDDNSFCQLLGVNKEEFTFEGFCIGYPSDSFELQPVNYPDFENNVFWLP
jgi:nitroreductase